jgi:hypothetical protein
MSKNLLSKYFRKPQLYVQIPTGGKFNPEIDKTILDEIGILPMTAVDEISLENPDALLNGEALINLIQSCVPSIKDARQLCNIDVEALFLAIKYATYGKDITHTHTCSECKAQGDYNIDINYLLDKFPDISEVEPIEYEDLKIHVQPAKIESITRLALMEVEQRRILESVRKSVNDEEDELTLAKTFSDGFRKVAIQNIDLVTTSIARIETPQGDTVDEEEIRQFLNDIPAPIVKTIQSKVKELSKKPDDLSKFEFTCADCGHKDEITLEINPVNFS